MTTMVFSASVAGPSQDKTQAAGAGTVQAKTADPLYPIEVNGKYGFINGKGTVVIEAVYDGYGYSGVPGGTLYVEDHAAKKSNIISVRRAPSCLNTS
ncbi:WG repeat-containing protein [Paenibacillus rhizoplanae]